MTSQDTGHRPRIALITGAARRIGACIARTLHAAGYAVVIHYRNSGREAQQLTAALNDTRGGSAFAVHADLTVSASARALVDGVHEHFGALDLLVNSASTFYPTPLAAIDEHAWDELIGSNLKGPLLLCQRAAEPLAQRNGAIVNIVDIHARRPLANYSLYCAAKAGLVALTRSLALELAPEVRVNAVAPGAILWPEGDATLTVEERQRITLSTPLARCGDPGDVAAAVLYLARDAGYVTGQVLTVDGGRSL